MTIQIAGQVKVKIKVKFLDLSNLLKLDASEQQKCLMLCND